MKKYVKIVKGEVGKFGENVGDKVTVVYAEKLLFNPGTLQRKV
jgi:hypothetical protein